MKKYESLLQCANELVVKEFKSAKQAKHYAHELHEKMVEEENRLMEEQRKLQDIICKLRIEESKVFDYYLFIK